jgi:hypothetical protein
MGILVAPLSVICVGAAMVVGHLRRTNRVGPVGVAGAAPLTWLWSPGWAATLHRRLRSASALASSVAGPPAARSWRRRRPSEPPDSIAELAREVVGEAVRLDHELVTATLNSPGAARAHALNALDFEVRGVEDAARRVHRLATRRAQLSAGAVQGLSLHDRIASMEAALGELSAGPRPLN